MLLVVCLGWEGDGEGGGLKMLAKRVHCFVHSVPISA
jgi:hypothetical protein